MVSHLQLLRNHCPEYPLPDDPEPRDYPVELGAMVGDRRMSILMTNKEAR